MPLLLITICQSIPQSKMVLRPMYHIHINFHLVNQPLVMDEILCNTMIKRFFDVYDF